MSTNPWIIPYKCMESATQRATGAILLGHCVSFAGAHAAAGTEVYGIARNDMASGKDVTLDIEGEAIAKSGAAIASVGMALTHDSTGRLVPAVEGDVVFARSLQVTTAADHYLRVKITREGKLSNSSDTVAIAASGAITANYCVGFDLAETDGAGEAVYGIALATVADTESVMLQVAGRATGTAGDALATVGTAVTSANTGKLVAATTGDVILGRTLTTAAADGDPVDILITREGISD